MKHNKLVVFLSCVLFLACLILSGTLYSIHKKANYLPDSAVDDIVKILESDDIHIDPQIIMTKLEMGTVYVCASDEYNNITAETIGGERVWASYTVPDGEIIVLSSGARFEFYENFSFRYSLDEEKKNLLDDFNLAEADKIMSAGAVSRIGDIVKKFLERDLSDKENVSSSVIETKVEGVWELDGKHYALCSRTVGGVPMAGNTIICLIEGGVVTQASGTWCFFEIAESYSAQLTDHLNILFSVKKDVTSTEREGVVTIESIEPCYSVYLIEDYFSLIPCWKVETDTMGKFIYNAINGTLVTKN